MMSGPRRTSEIFNQANRQRLLKFSFWSVLTLLVAFIASTYIVDGKTQQSAYGDDWDDLGDFRSEINSMGVETTAMVSSPLLYQRSTTQRKQYLWYLALNVIQSHCLDLQMMTPLSNCLTLMDTLARRLKQSLSTSKQEVLCC